MVSFPAEHDTCRAVPLSLVHGYQGWNAARRKVWHSGRDPKTLV